MGKTLLVHGVDRVLELFEALLALQLEGRREQTVVDTAKKHRGKDETTYFRWETTYFRCLHRKKNNNQNENVVVSVHSFGFEFLSCVYVVVVVVVVVVCVCVCVCVCVSVSVWVGWGTDVKSSEISVMWRTISKPLSFSL